jgi:DNA-binding NtrC family response regulator
MKLIRPDVKVLLSTGYSLGDEAQAILQRGCLGFIQKPFSLKKFSVKIDEVLRK